MITCALVVILLVNFTSGQSINKRMKRREEMDGKTCKITDVLFSKDGPGYVGCVALCGKNPNCKSLFHNPSTGGCTGCTTVYENSTDGASTPDEAGTQYYVQFALYGQACDFEMPCGATMNVCEDGFCVCDPFTNFNPGSRLCTDGCVTYGTTFTKYKRRTLDGHNEKDNKPMLNINTCLQRCHEATDYLCYAVGYNFNVFQCFYKNESPRLAPGDWRNATGNNIHIRNCQ